MKEGQFVRNRRGQLSKILKIIDHTTITLSEWNNFDTIHKNYYPKNIKRWGWEVLDGEQMNVIKNELRQDDKKELLKIILTNPIFTMDRIAQDMETLIKSTFNLVACDKFYLLERQLRIVRLELDNLNKFAQKVTNMQKGD